MKLLNNLSCKLNFLVGLAGLFLSSTVFSNNVAKDDLEYLHFGTKRFNFIFPKEYQEFSNKIISTTDQLANYYEKIYDHKLDEKTEFMLASEFNQIGNGYATMLPYSSTMLYPGGIFLFDDFASTNWIATLVYHEMSHLYQLNVKTGSLNRFSKFLFGNNWVSFFPIPIAKFPFLTFPFPVTTHPNVLTPDFLLEGNAVFNESRFGYGGRLYSGHFRAIFYLLLKEGKIEIDRIINNTFDFPYLREKYIVGAYFYNYLAYTYGIEKSSAYFKAQSKHYINPLLFSSTFEEHFGDDFEEVLHQAFIKHSLNSVILKNERDSKLIATSSTYNPLNRNKNGAYFLSSQDGVAEPMVYVVPVDGNVSNKKTNLKNGKLFYIDGAIHSAAIGLVDKHKKLPSLWGENRKLNKKFVNKYIFDEKNGKFIYADGKRSLERPFLMIDDKDVGESYSSALISPDGKPVYFTQKGKVRTLMRGNEALYSYKGYYGKPVDILPTGAIVFVGPTSVGSGLFMHSYGEVVRIGSSDLVVDARWLRDTEFLIVEVGIEGYEYRRADLSYSRYQEPHEYAYFFEKDFHKEDIPLKEGKGVEYKSKSYNELRNLRFSSFNLYYNSVLHNRTKFYSNGIFVDPLNYNELNLTVTFLRDFRDKYFKGLYLNKKNILNWGFYYEVESDDVDRDKYQHSFRLILDQHLFRWDDWDLKAGFSTGFSFGESGSSWDNYLNLEFAKYHRAQFSFYPYDEMNLFFELDHDKNGLLANISAGKIMLVPYDFHLLGEVQIGFTNRALYDVGDFIGGKNRILSIISLPTFNRDFDVGGTAMFGVKKVFSLPYYSYKNPLGLRRVGLGVHGGLAGSSETKYSGAQYGVTVDSELILGHRFVSKLRVELVTSSFDQQLLLGLEGVF